MAITEHGSTWHHQQFFSTYRCLLLLPLSFPYSQSLRYPTIISMIHSCPSSSQVLLLFFSLWCLPILIILVLLNHYPCFINSWSLVRLPIFPITVLCLKITIFSFYFLLIFLSYFKPTLIILREIFNLSCGNSVLKYIYQEEGRDDLFPVHLNRYLKLIRLSI